ncbi:MAG: HAD-IA family hydrolase [Novosphingobium sp.]|nr:HAD-IA family hydrolase [Novosphingobium sp.]
MIADPDELDRFLAEVVSEDWHFQHDAGRPAAEMVAERIAEFPAHAPLIAAWAERFHESIPGPVDGMPELLDRLAASGIPLYAITNFGPDFWASFRPTQPMLAHFRDIVVSGNERLTKPDAAIFHLAERRFGHRPETMLFIDDSLANVAAARACGWHAHHFTGAAALAAELRARRLLD